MSCNQCNRILQAAEQKLEAAKEASSRQPDNQELKQRLTEVYSDYQELYEAWVSGDLCNAISGCQKTS